MYRLLNSHILRYRNMYHFKVLWYLYSPRTVTGTWSSPPGNKHKHKQLNFQEKILLKPLWKTSIFLLHVNGALPQFVAHTDLSKSKKSQTLNELVAINEQPKTEKQVCSLLSDGL